MVGAVSKAKAQIDQRGGAADRKPLRVHPDGFSLLRDRLQEPNRDNPQFEAQFARLESVLREVLSRLERKLGDRVERVQAYGEWVREGIDLRRMPYEEVLVLIVVRAPERIFELDMEIAEKVFLDLDDKDIFMQFTTDPLPDWRRAEAVVAARGDKQALGIPLLDRE